MTVVGGPGPPPPPPLCYAGSQCNPRDNPLPVGPTEAVGGCCKHTQATVAQPTQATTQVTVPTRPVPNLQQNNGYTQLHGSPPHQLRPTEVTNTRAQVPTATPHNDYRQLPLNVSKAAQNSFRCHHVTSERGVDLYHYTTGTQHPLPQGNTHREGLTTQPPADNTPPPPLTSDTHTRTQAPTTPSFDSELHTKEPPSPLTSDTHTRTQAPTTPSFDSELHTKEPPSPLPHTGVG